MHLVNSHVFSVKEGEVLWRRGIKTKKKPQIGTTATTSNIKASLKSRETPEDHKNKI